MIDNELASARVLLVSREPSELRGFWSIGEANAWQLEIASNGWEALDRVQSGSGLDLVLLDLAPGDADGLHTLRWLRRVRPNLPIILLSSADDIREKLEAIRSGAQDYLSKPLQLEQLEAVIRRHLDMTANDPDGEEVGEEIEQIDDELFFVAACPAMRKLRSQAELLAQVNVPLLILGESGSGKETVARLIHKLSVRSSFRFLKVNCSALPGDLLESELFGYERSTSNGAARPKTGKLDLCDRGTIFLNAITEMPQELQAKLLHLLQDKQSPKAGHEPASKSDVRIVAATNISVEQALAHQKLREDLYYRLSGFTIHVPPLRQRRDEIPLLLGYFMNRLARRYDLPSRSFSQVVLDACQSYSWPKNLKEMENFVKRYLVNGDESQAIGELDQPHGFSSDEDAGFEYDESAGSMELADSDSPHSLKSFVQSVKGEAEKNAIANALETTHWNRKAAARLLGVSYRTLLYKIQQYQMRPFRRTAFAPQRVASKTEA